MALWGFGSGHASLNPALAGWHRGEREVTAPQHTTHKTLRIVGKRRKRVCLKYTLTQDYRPLGVSGSHFGFKHTHTHTHPGYVEPGYQ